MSEYDESKYLVYATPDPRFVAKNNLENRRYLYPDPSIVFLPLSHSTVAIVDKSTIGSEYPSVMTISDWYRVMRMPLRIQVSIQTILARLEKGWTFEDAIKYGPRQGPYTAYSRFDEKRVIDGECKTFREWCDEYNISTNLVLKRMKFDKMSFADALRAPSKTTGPKAKKYKCGNEEHTLKEWSAVTGIPIVTLRNRLYMGWSIEEALGTPTVTHRRAYVPREEVQGDP